MALTHQQQATLKAFIVADPVLNAFPQNSDGAFAIAALINQPATPTFFVWRTRVDQQEVMLNGFDWTRVDNLSIGKARIWEWMFESGDDSINPSNPNIRAGIIACWTGTQADQDVRLVVFTHCQRPASVVEKVFATGDGTTVQLNGTGPATMGVVGPISFADVQTARES